MQKAFYKQLRYGKATLVEVANELKRVLGRCNATPLKGVTDKRELPARRRY